MVNKKIKEIKEALDFMTKTGDVSRVAFENLSLGLEELDDELNLSAVSHLLIAWEQYKKANWWESDSVDVEKYLMEQFKAIYCG